MEGVRMTTSDLEKALKGKISWASFCHKYSDEKNTYLLRHDGILTSSDLKMKFDLQESIVEKQGVRSICMAALDGMIDEYDVSFIANAILLSAFEFENDDLEDVCHLLSNIERLDEIEEVKVALGL